MITIVSGLPRSGTSLMMQMLAAGGLSVLSDGERKANTDNPRGYLEWERIKQLPKEPSLIAEAEGKVVKVISQLLLSLPDGHEYRVVFMQRPLPEVLKSQDEMLRRRGTYEGGDDNSPIEEAFQRHLIEVNRWLNGKPNVQVLRVHYHRTLREPKATAEAVAEFLKVPLNVEAMTREVDPSLLDDSYWDRLVNYLNTTNVQISGASVKLSAVELKAELKTSPSFRQQLQAALNTRLPQITAQVCR